MTYLAFYFSQSQFQRTLSVLNLSSPRLRLVPWWRSRHWQFFRWIALLDCFEYRWLSVDLFILFAPIYFLELGIHRILERTILSIEYLLELDPAMYGLLLSPTPPVCVLVLQYNIFHFSDWLLDLGLLLTLAVLVDDSIRQFHSYILRIIMCLPDTVWVEFNPRTFHFLIIY